MTTGLTSSKLKILIPAVCLIFLGTVIETKADPVNLNTAGNYGELYIGGNGNGGTDISGNHSGVNGTAGIASNGLVDVGGGGFVSGNLSAASSANLHRTEGIQGQVLQGAGTDAALAQAAADARAASAQAAGMASTNNLTALTLSGGSTTINGTGGVNVLNLTDIALSGGTHVILNGSASSSFVINVTGELALSGNSQILLEGGINPNNVIFNVEGAGPKPELSGHSVLTGVILTVDRDVNISGGFVNGEVISGGEIHISSGGQITQQMGPPPSVPEPASLLLLGTGLAGVARKLRKRRGKSAEAA